MYAYLLPSGTVKISRKVENALWRALVSLAMCKMWSGNPGSQRSEDRWRRGRLVNCRTLIGSTGTPMFPANAGAGGRTTADLFPAGLKPDGTKRDSCLHRYMIKDAIADGNVLRFSVEYQRTIFARNLALKGIDPEQLDDPEYCKHHMTRTGI